MNERGHVERMSSDYRPLLGMELDESGIDELLTEAGVGVLSMSADGVPYGVPLSFGYDGVGSLYFVFLGSTTELRKETYAEESDVASFTTFDIGADGSWRSVIVAGPLDRITPGEWDAAREAMIDNAYQSNLLAEYELQENPNVWALEIQERSGRAVGRR
jgi:nitroimidazol reductase NimA-like FMN-containing flavoprotein (pyridoxamine 5'-phosphate oxidase superfamily)